MTCINILEVELKVVTFAGIIWESTVSKISEQDQKRSNVDDGCYLNHLHTK